MALVARFEADHFIGGRRMPPAEGDRIPVVDPATREVIGAIARGSAIDVDEAVSAARGVADAGTWSRIAPSERSKRLLRLAGLIREQADELAELEMTDVGKPIGQARREVESAARSFEFAASAIDKVMGDTIPVEPGSVAMTLREPWGVCGLIVPWNYPINLAARGLAPALAMGNSAVLKPAEDASRSCLRLAELAVEAGLPAGTLNVVTGYGSEAGAALAGHNDVDHVTFTGSVATGSKVMELAARNVVPVSLELGGKSPQIVFADADLELAIPSVVKSFVSNAGQTCVAGTRLLVQSAAQGEVVRALRDAIAGVKLGHPMQDPDLGPLISERQHLRVREYLEVARDEGLELVAGGGAPATDLLPGYYVEPTVFDNTPTTSRLFREEIFGPVLCIAPFETLDEAIALANDTDYGLMATVWTANVTNALALVSELRSGQVYVNTGGLSESGALPFGGYKRSGFGRAKGMEAMRAYSQSKTVAIRFA